MERGDVYVTDIELPDREAGGTQTERRRKLCVVLQGGPEFLNQTDVAFVVASTYRGWPPRAFEVLVGVREGFEHESVIDCRWVYTVPKAELSRGRHLFRVGSDVLEMIDEALVVGLQMASDQ